MSIAEKIKAVRKAKGITPSHIASVLGIEVTNYPRLENRGNKLTYEYIEKIAGALGVLPVELLTWGEDKTADTDSNSDASHLRERVSELEEQVADKTKIGGYQDKHIRRVELWLCNYFRYEVWKVAVRLGMIEKDVNYMHVNEYYKQWGQEGINRIVAGGLIQNPFVYQMMYRSIYLDDALFIEPTNDYVPTENVFAFQVRTKDVDWSDVMSGQTEGLQSE